VPNTGQYLYDANGNMTYDPSKKITVSYNPLNLPRLVEFDNDDNITYTYTATGTKLRKTVTSWKTTTGGTTDYAGQFLYQDNELSCIFTPVGRIVPMQYNDETFWKHEYNLKDHLGNTRIVFAAHPHGQPEVMQQTSYYPFGMTLQQQNFGGVQSQPNKLLYNGKELQDDELAGVSLDWYDYGFRFYDPSIVRFGTMDPIADLFSWQSSYAYAANNPIRYIDFMGMSPVGADGLTNDQWLETSRPGADPELKKEYIAQNRNQEHQKRQMASVFSMSPEELSKRGFSGYYVTNTDGEILSHTVDGMGTFYSGGGDQAQSDGGGGTPEWITNTGRGVGAFMPANTTKEVLIDYVRTTGNIGKTGAKYLKIVRGAGVTGSLIGVGVSGVNIYNDYDKNGNGFGDVNNWDVADASVGIAGLGVTGLVTLGLVSNPIGWGVAIGTGVYFGARLIYDIATDE
jgi:RHS repeat-associated protein